MATSTPRRPRTEPLSWSVRATPTPPPAWCRWGCCAAPRASTTPRRPHQAAASPADVPAQILASDLDLLDGDVAGALNRLIDTVVATDGADRDAARVHLLELFDLIGATDPAVLAARTRLASALF